MWSKFAALAKSFGPMIMAAVLSTVPGGAVLGPLVGDAIVDVETLMGSGTGAAKKAAVLATVSDAVTAINTAKGTVVIDPVAAAAQVSTGIDLTIGVLNDIKTAQGTAA